MLPSKDTLERVRLTFGTVVSALLFALLVLLLVRPGAVLGWATDRLSEAELEVTEFMVFGVRLQSLRQASREAQDQIAVARSEIDRLEAENADLRSQIASLSSLPPAIVAPAPGPDLREQLNAAIRSLEEAQPSPRTEAPAAEGSWIAIFGADRTLPAAEFEYNTLIAAGYQGALLQRDGFYRTVAVFPSRSEAAAALPALARVMRREGYVREFNAWCPGAIATDDVRIVRCGTR